MTYLAAYITAFLVFGIVDLLWLSLLGAALYRPIIGELLAPSVRIAPAVVFYLAYPIGLVVFAVLPALREDSVVSAVRLGFLFGALAYATYDLTNHATMRVWSTQITVIDIAYGAFASAVASALAYYAVTLLVARQA
ncbi:hypothetical protein GJW-30_1_04169 [Variibacter gotjawalensis]|uniref:DUF2177 domain-containing protein n=1 Tax=Variibacter gotjawalensis TaxID=1333996 RepID=A0A0S3Q086_9BRAD|nr:DUF2177 family protein [Variibacter gotjawalensis]NIK47451.1 putative membrane protein [Variibacter gotjawalensis]RZS49346.1 putative membrane protein [Variibacter gotjawalensis]BAT61610.1 hypothetical protein GJW-30_1_04169 [Variibacter gotjawalensis]